MLIKLTRGRNVLEVDGKEGLEKKGNMFAARSFGLKPFAKIFWGHQTPLQDSEIEIADPFSTW